MKFTYCPFCGTKTILKEIGDEGIIPYCDVCKTPLWDMFRTSIITAVTNEYNEVALLRQDYVSTTHHVCVAGVMKPGESAEETVVREVKEELGLKVNDLSYVKSYPYGGNELLMLGFHSRCRKADFVLSGEVDSAEWVSYDNALGKLREGSIAWRLVKAVIEGENK